MWLIILVILQAFETPSVHSEDDLQRKVDDSSVNPGNDAEATALFHRLFESAPASKLSAFRNSDSLSLSLRASWESVRRRLPEAEQRNLIGVDEVATSRFLGFVEGRLQATPPDFWEEALLSAKAYDRSALAFVLPRQLPDFAEDGGRYLVPKGIVVKETESGLLVSHNKATCRVPNELIARAEGMRGLHAVDALFHGECCYLTLRGDRCRPYICVSANTMSGKINWVQDVWAAGENAVYTGKGFHLVSLVLSGDVLNIFGVGDDCAYIEVFATRDGSNKCRFCTRR